VGTSNHGEYLYGVGCNAIIRVLEFWKEHLIEDGALVRKSRLHSIQRR
jgi:hypothetical protein